MENQNQQMENQQSSNEMTKSTNTWMIIGSMVILVILGLWLWLGYKPAAAPEADISGSELSQEDTTLAIEQELQVTDLGDIDAELDSLEEDLQSL